MLRLNIQRFANAGVVEVEIRANTKKLDKDMVEAQKRFEELDKKARQQTYEIDGVKINDANSEILNLTKEEAKEYEELINLLGIANKEEEQRLESERQVVQETQKTTEEIKKQNAESKPQVSRAQQLTGNIRALADSYNLINKQDIISEEDVRQMDDIKKKIQEAVKEYEKLTGNKLSVKGITDTENKFGGVKEAINSAGKSMESIIKKVAKWSLAIIGIRSIYLGIRSAMSQLTSDDDELSAKVDYMKWALANAIKPVIEWIIQAMYNILSLVGSIIYTFTGYNIFEKSGIKDYEKSLKSSKKEAKKLQKTLAGFDEMNVINDSGNTGTANVPSNVPDLSDIDKYENKVQQVVNDLTKKWFDLGKDMKKALENPEAFDKAYGNWSQFMQGITLLFVGLWDTLTGAVEFIGGILDVIVGLFTGDFEKVKDGFFHIWEGIKKFFAGIIETLMGLWKTFTGFVYGLFSELMSGLWGLITWIWDSVVGILSSVCSWIYDHIIKPVGNFFAGMWNGFKDGASKAWEGVKSIFSKVANFFREIFSKAWEGVKSVFSGTGQIFINIKDGILQAFKNIVNVIIDGINAIVAIPFNGINTAFNNLRSVDLWGWKPFEWVPQIRTPQIPRLAKGGIINNPGQGVAIGGESGPEAVVPLTDAQQMAILGEAIARNVIIDLTTDVNIDGRLLTRRVDKIQQNNNFVLNR